MLSSFGNSSGYFHKNSDETQIYSSIWNYSVEKNI